jgi:hypothetical protein
MKTLMFAVAFGVTTLATQAGAQSAPVNGGREGFTRAEIQQFADALFDRFDLNHDGMITRDEAEQARTQLASGEKGAERADRAEKMIERFFGTAESLSRSQFEAISLARFDKQDANHDGVVTRDERGHGREQNAPGQ